MGSVVDSVKELMERIHHLHEELDVPILIDEYIEGREIYSAIIGNRPPEALPLVHRREYQARCGVMAARAAH